MVQGGYHHPAEDAGPAANLQIRETEPVAEPPISRIEANVQRVRGLLARRAFGQALADCETLLLEVPENRDVLYLAAVSQRYLGRIADALKTLQRGESCHPQYGRLFQERGHCYRAVNEIDAAIAAYRQAVLLNPTLRASWIALRDLQGGAGAACEAEHAATQLNKLDSLPASLRHAMNQFHEGDARGARAIVQGFLQSQPGHLEAMRLLAQICISLDALEEAESLLESVLRLAPDHHAARHEYASVLSRLHKYCEARAELHTLLAIEPESPAYRATYAYVCAALGRHEEALDLYGALAAQQESRADLQLSIAHAQKALGRAQDAVSSYRRALALQPDCGDAYWSLANLKTYRFSDEELAAMREQLASAATLPADRYRLCFALGKALEDRGDYPESFRYYEQGNALKREEVRYAAELFERDCDRQKAACTAEFFAARRAAGLRDPSPIFIVGLPRSGSTLLEQILASHSQIEGTMELHEITRLVNQLQQRDSVRGCERAPAEGSYPAILGALHDEEFTSLGARYIEDTRIFRSGKAFFIDKMPNNFRHIGLIHLILPCAKIIDARREAMACCFSNFKQLFAFGQDFTYSLEDLGRYYRAYVNLMQHWNEVLPGRILHVQYEGVVADLEGSVRRILEFCGLEFETACLKFHETHRSIRTASSEQVRRPIFTESLEQWRHFDPWLAPLKEALGGLA